MTLSIDCTKKLVTKTDRVKQLVFHPTETWIATALYDGTLVIYDYNSGGTVKVFQVSEAPLRACAFIPSNNLVVCAGDDLMIRAFHYGNGKKIFEVDGHSDYIRSLAVCPNDRYLLSSSDDANVKLWDIDDFTLKTTYEGHSHYVMQVAWHPNGQLFASASLDKTVRVWSPSTAARVLQPNFVLKGHTKAVNCVTFSPGSTHQNILVSGGDDFLAVWDFHTKQLLHKLEGHTSPINAVVFHPVYPVIISGGEDSHVRLWNSNTYKKQDVLQFHVNRIWSLAAKGDDSCLIGIGSDVGSAVIAMGKYRMVFSYHGGKILYCRHNRVFVSNLRAAARGDQAPIEDGAVVPIATKELGTTDMFAQSCVHQPSGRFVAVCGENEYFIYTATALRSKAFGSAQAFTWSSDGDYATLNHRTNASQCIIDIFKDFKEHKSFLPGTTVDALFGGRFLGVVDGDGMSFSFYDWASGHLVRTFEVPGCSDIIWSPSGEYIAVVTDDSTFILMVDEEGFLGEYGPEEGYVDAFQTIGEIHDVVTSLVWIVTAEIAHSESIAFVTSTNKLNLWMHGHMETLGFTGTTLTLVGWHEVDQTLILLDQNYNVVYFNCSRDWVAYHVLILQKEFAKADEIFNSIPSRYHDKVARFLETEGHIDKALNVTTDDEHRLKLALSLNNLTAAASILEDIKRRDPNSPTLIDQWKSLGDAALAAEHNELAAGCFLEANDFTSCLLIYSSLGDRKNLERVAELAANEGQVELTAYTYIHLNFPPEKVIDLYLGHGHPDQAALFARTYAPEHLPRCVEKWEKLLGSRFHVECPDIPVREIEENIEPELEPVVANKAIDSPRAPASRLMSDDTTEMQQQTDKATAEFQDIEDVAT